MRFYKKPEQVQMVRFKQHNIWPKAAAIY